MKYRLFIIMFFVTLNGFSQKPASKGKAIHPGTGMQKQNKAVTDTIQAKIPDTVIINKTDTSKELKIIIAKEAGSSDWLKTLLPILTLLLGIFLNRGLDLYRDKRKIKKSGKRWHAEVLAMEEPIRQQITILKKTITDISADNSVIPNLTINALLDGTGFKSFDKSELLDYFRRKNDFPTAVKLSNKVHGFISIFSSHHEALTEKYIEFKDNTSNRYTSLSKNLGLLMDAFRDYVVVIEREMPEGSTIDPNYTAMLKLFDNEIFPFRQSGEVDIYRLENNFMDPFADILWHIRLDSRISDMLRGLSACMADIKGIKMEKRYLTENFEQIVLFFEEDLVELKEVSDVMTNAE